MLMQPFNELLFGVTVESTSPLLIKESRYTDEDKKRLRPNKDDRKGMPDVIPISRATQREIDAAVVKSNPLSAVARFPFFLPAASLRGALRSHLERSLRGLNGAADPRVCDPFEESLAEGFLSCSSALTERRERDKGKKSAAAWHPYALSCPVCRLFGSTLQGSRISLSDGLRVDPAVGELVQREHVRINRRTGGVTGAPLKFYGLLGTRFRFEIRLRNFELAHVVLMGLLLNDLGRGNLPLGSGKSKGYGRVKLHQCSIALSYYGDIGTTQPMNELRGVAEHPDPATQALFQKKYSLSAQKVVSLTPGTWREVSPWRRDRDWSFKEFQETWPQLSLEWSAVGPLSQRLAAEG